MNSEGSGISLKNTRRPAMARAAPITWKTEGRSLIHVGRRDCSQTGLPRQCCDDGIEESMTCSGHRRPPRRRAYWSSVIGDKVSVSAHGCIGGRGGVWAGDVIVAAEVSRLARSPLQVLELLEIAAAKAVSVHIVKGHLVPDGSLQATITATVLGLAVQIERELIAARTKEALARRKAQGLPLGRPKGPAVRVKLDSYKDQIVTWLQKGVSKRAIARILECSPSTPLPYPTRQGEAFYRHPRQSLGVLFSKVTCVSVTMPPLKMPPPLSNARLSEKVLFSTVSVLSLKMPPPKGARLPAMVLFSTVILPS